MASSSVAAAPRFAQSSSSSSAAPSFERRPFSTPFSKPTGASSAAAPIEDMQSFRCTLTSRNVALIESTCQNLIVRARDENIETAGPVRLPTKFLSITTRKTPCGEGSKTWDRFEMRIHKRIINFKCTVAQLRSLTAMKVRAGLQVDISMPRPN